MRICIARFTIESRRVHQVLEARLANTAYLAGGIHSLADIAWYPWIEYHA